MRNEGKAGVERNSRTKNTPLKRPLRVQLPLPLLFPPLPQQNFTSMNNPIEGKL